MQWTHRLNKLVGTGGHIGPGGMNCACCGPAPGKPRVKFLRAAKKRIRRQWKKEAAECS